MKLIKVFGMVLALHIVLLTVFFLSPGCQSTPQKPVETAEPQEAAPAPVAAAENWTNQPAATGYAGSGSALTPTPASGYATASAAPLTGLTPAERVRAAPSRPANPDEFIGGVSSFSSQSAAPAQPAAGAAPALTEYTVKPGDSLWRISRAFSTTVGEIVAANPGVKADSLKPGDVLKIPAGAAVSPSAAPAGAASVTSAAATSTYTVKPGDSLSKIAARNGTTVAALKKINNLTSDVIQIGQVLVVPGGAAGPAPGPAREAVPTGGVTVTVQRGDTLGAIARKFDVSVRDLMEVNGITDPRRVRAGQVLVIPGYEAVGSGQVPSEQRPFTAPRAAESAAPPPATAVAPSETEPAPEDTPATEPVTGDLDDLIPPDVLDAPVVPIDEPVPQP